MSETPRPDGDLSPGVPPAWDAEPTHPAAAIDPSYPPPPPRPPYAPVVPAEPDPSKPPKAKLHWGYALLGFVTPWILNYVGGVLMADTWLASSFSALYAVSELGIIAGVVAAYLIGRSRGNNRLRSFGIGGLTSYVVSVLLGLLLVGACFLSLSGWNR